MRDRGQEGNRESGRREEWRDNNPEREPQYSSEERNRQWGQERRYGWGREEGTPGGYSEYGAGEGRWNERRGYASEPENWRNQGRGDDRGYEGSNEGWERGNQDNRRDYPSQQGQRNYRRGDYGPGAFTRQFAGGTEYFGTGQRGFGTTWGGSNYTGFGGAGYTGGMGSYAEQGQHSGRGPKGYQRSDERIREDVCERLTHHPGVDASEIEIQVKSGEVTLTGTVERREEKRMAEEAAEAVSGVKDVHNQLRMQHQGVGVNQSSSSGGSQPNRETASPKTK